MNDLRSITLRVFSQSLLFTVLAFFSFPVFAQQSTNSAQKTGNPVLPYPFNNLKWLNCDIKDEVQKSILYEYGAVYFSTVLRKRKQSDSIPCRFTEAQAEDFVESLKKMPATKFSFGDFYLQPQAKISFKKVIASTGYQSFARNCNDKTLKTCVHTSENLKDKLNDDWALRNYEQTVKNWGFLAEATDTEKENDVKNEVKKIIVFTPPYNKDKRPKVYKVAIPGTSQHHLGLAIDVVNANPLVCRTACVTTLMKNGWYRTVRYDAYHFTYLGIVENNMKTAEIKLRNLGLKKVRCKDYDEKYKIEYWVPKVKYKNEQNKNVPYKGLKNWECKDV